MGVAARMGRCSVMGSWAFGFAIKAGGRIWGHWRREPRAKTGRLLRRRNLGKAYVQSLMVVSMSQEPLVSLLIGCLDLRRVFVSLSEMVIMNG